MVSVTFVKAFLDVFRSFVTGSMSLRFHSTIERIFMVIWVLFGIIMTSAFQGSLTSYLSVPKYLKDINTLKEVVESNIWLFIYGTDNTVSFLDQDDESMARLRRKLIITPNLFEAFDKITKQDDVGFVMNEYGAKFMLSSREFTKEGYPILHGVKQSLLTNYNAYEIPRHSPYLDTFNLVIRRLTESGFQRKWYRDTNHQHSLNGNFTDSFFLNNARASPLTLKHMQTSFYILMFGLFISFVAFLTEVCR
jgi:Ligand-gated ion channel.